MAKVRLKTVDRALCILMLFNQGHFRLSVREISASLNIPLSTGYKYIEVLTHHDFLRPDRLSGYYRLGGALLRLASSMHAELERDLIMQPIMEALKDQTGETVFLTAIRGQEGICLNRVESDHNVRFSFQPGNTLPLHAGASGKVLLAYLNEERRRTFLANLPLTKYTKYTITDREKLATEVEEIRKRGYAISSEERDIGARAVAVPILDSRGELDVAITVCGPVRRFGVEKIPCYAEYAISAAVEASTALREKGVIL